MGPGAPHQPQPPRTSQPWISHLRCEGPCGHPPCDQSRGCWRRDKLQPRLCVPPSWPRPGTCGVGLARHPPQALVTVPQPLLESLLQHLGLAVLQAQSWVRASSPSAPIAPTSCWHSPGLGRNPGRSRLAGVRAPLPPGPSPALTGTEENRHIQASWTRLRRDPAPSMSLAAVPSLSSVPSAGNRDPGERWRNGDGSARLCQPPTPGGDTDVLPRPAEEILGTSWAVTAPGHFPDGTQTSGSTRQSSQGVNGSHVFMSLVGFHPPLPAPRGANATARADGTPQCHCCLPAGDWHPGYPGKGLQRQEAARPLWGPLGPHPQAGWDPHPGCAPPRPAPILRQRPLPAQRGLGGEEQLSPPEAPRSSPSLQAGRPQPGSPLKDGPPGLSPTSVPTRVPSRSRSVPAEVPGLRRLPGSAGAAIPMSRCSRYSRCSRQPRQRRWCWQPRCSRCSQWSRYSRCHGQPRLREVNAAGTERRLRRSRLLPEPCPDGRRFLGGLRGEYGGGTASRGSGRPGRLGGSRRRCPRVRGAPTPIHGDPPWGPGPALPGIPD